LTAVNGQEITILCQATSGALAPTHGPLFLPEPPIALQNIAAKGIAEEFDVVCTTGQRAVERLQAAGIVSPVGSAKRSRVYCARDMLEVLEAPRAAGRSVLNETSPHKRYGNER